MMTKLTDRRKAALDTMMKNAIDEATVKVLTEHGLEGMTMDQVADAAGVAKGTLYNYFSDKTALIAHACERIFEPFMEKVAEIVRDTMEPEKKLESIVEAIFNNVNENIALLNILAEYHVHQIPETKQHRNKMSEGIETIAPVIAEGIRKGHFRKVDPTRTASMFLGAINQLIHTIIGINHSRPTKENVTELMDLFLPGLRRKTNAKEC